MVTSHSSSTGDNAFFSSNDKDVARRAFLTSPWSRLESSCSLLPAVCSSAFRHLDQFQGAAMAAFPRRKEEMTCKKEKVSAPGFCAGNANGGVVASHPLIKQQPSSCSGGSILSQRPFTLIAQRAEDATLALELKDRAGRNFARGSYKAGGKVISVSRSSFSYYSFLITYFFLLPPIKTFLCRKKKTGFHPSNKFEWIPDFSQFLSVMD